MHDQGGVYSSGSSSTHNQNVYAVVLDTSNFGSDFNYTQYKIASTGNHVWLTDSAGIDHITFTS